jgi:hypothetical protein
MAIGAASQQGLVGSINDGLCVQLRDVATHKLEAFECVFCHRAHSHW